MTTPLNCICNYVRLVWPGHSSLARHRSPTGGCNRSPVNIHSKLKRIINIFFQNGQKWRSIDTIHWNCRTLALYGMCVCVCSVQFETSNVIAENYLATSCAHHRRQHTRTRSAVTPRRSFVAQSNFIIPVNSIGTDD